MNKLLFVVWMHAALILQAQIYEPARIEAWITKADRSELFSKHETPIQFSNDGRHGRSGATIIIDDGIQMQSVDGFGFALTGGSAGLLIRMNPAERNKLINELFGTDGNNIGVSYLRLTIGASDLNSFVYSYNDLKDGETDLSLEKFNLAQDFNYVTSTSKKH